MNEKELANDENVDRKKRKKKRNEMIEMRNIHFSFLIIITMALLLTEAQNVSCYVLKLQLIVVSIKRNVRDIPKDVTQTGNRARRKWTQNMKKKKKQRIDHGLLLSKVLFPVCICFQMLVSRYIQTLPYLW